MTQNTHVKITTGIDIVQSTASDLGIDTNKVPADLTALELTSGTGNGNVSKAFADERSISASGSENLDLYGGLTDGQGNTLNFAAIKAIEIIADDGNTNNVVVGNAATNVGFVGWFGDISDTIAIPPGGRMLLCAPNAGWAVTNSTADTLKIANSSSGSSVTYKIRLAGT